MNKNGRHNKRQRLDNVEGEKADSPSEIDVRLGDELRGLLGGRKYVKAKDLTREILLEYAKRQGAVTEGGNKRDQKEGGENVQLGGELG